MWSNVLLGGVSPATRCKHGCVLVGDGDNYNLYLFGGRSGTFPLKDFWKLNVKNGIWEEIKAKNEGPPYLQQTSLIYYDNYIFLFGGEISFSYGEDQSPLWIYSIRGNSWRRWGSGEKKLQSKTPLGRRGHTANLWNGYMLLYGGYRDLKGSLGDLWAFHFETESWHMFSAGSSTKSSLSWWSPSALSTPPARHGHVSVLHNSHLYIHGGMEDLSELSDFWKYNLNTRKWSCIVKKPCPGSVHGHVAISALNSLILLTGERSGRVIDNELWRFDFDAENWEKISFNCSRPCPRVDAWAGVIVPNTNVNLPVLVPKTVRKGSLFSNFFQAGEYEALSESNSVYEEDTTPDLLIDFDTTNNTTRRSESANCFTATVEKNNVKKSASTVRFADNPPTSDYSSMENGFENPNYSRTNAFEMGRVSRGESSVGNEVVHPPEPHSYMLLIGGNESHSSQVVKAPLSIWRLRLTHQLFRIVQNNTPVNMETTTGF